jgi:hypothetical protein
MPNYYQNMYLPTQYKASQLQPRARYGDANAQGGTEEAERRVSDACRHDDTFLCTFTSSKIRWQCVATGSLEQKHSLYFVGCRLWSRIRFIFILQVNIWISVDVMYTEMIVFFSVSFLINIFNFPGVSSVLRTVFKFFFPSSEFLPSADLLID